MASRRLWQTRRGLLQAASAVERAYATAMPTTTRRPPPSAGSSMPKFKHALGIAALRAARLEDESYDPKLWANICQELYYDLRQQSPQNISLVLNSLARLKIRDEALLDYIGDTLSPNWLKNFNIQDLALLCNSYAKLSHASPRLFQLCAEELLWKLPDGTPQELAMVANASAKVRAYDATLFRHLASLTQRSLEDFEPRHVANVLHAFARVDAVAPALFSSLSERLRLPSVASELEAIAAAQACFAVSRSVVRYPEALDSTARPLLDILARRLVAIWREPSTQLEVRHVAALSRACLDAGAFSRPLVRYLAGLLHVPEDAEASGARAILLDVVEAAASLRATAASAAAAGSKPLSGEVRTLDDVLRRSLTALHTTRATIQSRKQAVEAERRRLTTWDQELSEWLPDDWPSGLRQGLLG